MCMHVACVYMCVYVCVRVCMLCEWDIRRNGSGCSLLYKLTSPNQNTLIEHSNVLLKLGIE